MAETLKYADRCEAELQDLISYTDRSKQLEREFEEELRTYLVGAEELSERRRQAARRLERDIKKELRALAMDKTDFSVHLFRREGSQDGWIPGQCAANGIDQGEFLVSPNKGEDLKPLARIASGGELSRLTLSLRCLCGREESGKTLVFDEVDSGIGGRVAEVVGRRLRDHRPASSGIVCDPSAPDRGVRHRTLQRAQRSTVGCPHRDHRGTTGRLGQN